MKKIIYVILMMCIMFSLGTLEVPKKPTVAAQTLNPDKYEVGYVIFSNDRYRKLLNAFSEYLEYSEDMDDLMTALLATYKEEIKNDEKKIKALYDFSRDVKKAIKGDKK